jgi:hypothetical protein
MIALLVARRPGLLARDPASWRVPESCADVEPREQLPTQVKTLAPQVEPVYFTLQS